MMSVPSVKVRLAWSTIAQMGLMLIECALGLYAIALLHLLAHSVYKAHAFLSAGEAVQQHVMRLNAKAIPQILDWQLAIWVALCVLFAASYLGWVGAPYSPWKFLTGAAIVLLANSDLLSSPFKAIVPVVVMVLLYLIFKQAVTSIWPEIHHAYVWQFDGLVSLLLIGLLMAHITLFVVQRKQTALLPLLNAGFYLDEWSTRITLKIWPIRLPKNQLSINYYRELNMTLASKHKSYQSFNPLNAVDLAAQNIAPSWPLDQSIAVNPSWQLRQTHMMDTAAKLGFLGNIRLLMPKSYYQALWQNELTEQHLNAAKACLNITEDTETLLAYLDKPDVSQHWFI